MKYTMAGMGSQWIAAASLALTGISGSLLAVPVGAQNLPISTSQQATAHQVAQQGVPLSDLAPNAPEHYTVKVGDTLWAISALYLTSPWRWPELWGMNQQEIRNPHRIYPGQELHLVRLNGRAMLQAGSANGALQTVRLSPRTRYESLSDNALPTLKTHLIEPFLAEPLVVDEKTLEHAPRIVATQEYRVLLSRGDRAYARGPVDAPLTDTKGPIQQFRIFRNATPLKDPGSQEILGYEAQYIGTVQLASSEGLLPSKDLRKDGKPTMEMVPASIDIIGAKEEIRVGDRLLPEPARELLNFVPRAPAQAIQGRIVSVYGSAVTHAAQNQIVVINRGTQDGLERGHVLSLLTDGPRTRDKTDPEQTEIKLPDERNGLLMVFRPFEKLSYALILEIKTGVKIGDRLETPR